MKNKHNKGMTLIEFIVTILVLGIGLTGILSVMIVVTKNSVDPQLEWQAIKIGNVIMQEILDKKNNFPEGCNKPESSKKFVTLCDYQGIKNTPIERIFPELFSSLNAGLFNVSIDIKKMEFSDKNQNSALIEVSIAHQHFGKTVFSAIKAKGNDTHAQGSRFYTY